MEKKSVQAARTGEQNLFFTLFYLSHLFYPRPTPKMGKLLRQFWRGTNKKIKILPILLSHSQAGPGRTVKQEQEEMSRNHIQTFIYLS